MNNYYISTQISNSRLQMLAMLLLLAISTHVKSQNIGINSTGATPDASAMLDIVSSSKGLLIPRVALLNTTDAVTVPTPQTGLILYNTNAGMTGGQKGFYYNSGTPGAPTWTLFLTNGNTGTSWTIIGNANTTASSSAIGVLANNNFIGTTDAKDFVMTANGYERIRITSGGNVGVGIIAAAYPFDVRGSLANPVIYGNNATNSGIGIQGVNSAASGASTGIGVKGNTIQSAGYGVYGINTYSASNLGIGVGGFSDNYVAATPPNGAGGMFSSNNLGVYGRYNDVVYYGMGVQGVGWQGSNTVYNYDWGVEGNVGNTAHNGDAGIFGYYGGLIAIPNTPSGIMGISNINTSNGVYGYNVVASGASSGCGAVGVTLQSGGFGVYGVNSYATSGIGVGILGVGSGGPGYYQNGEGVAGSGYNLGVVGYASGNPYAGVWGVTSSLNAIFTNNEGVCGSGVYGVMGRGTSYGGYFDNTGGWWTYIGGGGYKVFGNGVVSTAVLDDNNKYRVLSCPEAPEVLFEDFGSSKLIGGRVHVDLDPLYAKNVSITDKHPLRVIITLNDECKGVYVTNRTVTGFDVVELNNGTSDAAFTYEVIANRADLYNSNHDLMAKFSDMRFEVGQGPQKASEGSELKSSPVDTKTQPANSNDTNKRK